MLQTKTQSTASNERALKSAVSSVLLRFKQMYPNIDLTRDTASAWTSFLSDLQPETILKTGKVLLLNSEYPTLPGIGLFRKTAEKLEGKWITATEALNLAQDHLAYNPRGYAYGLKLDNADLPDPIKALVQEAAKRFGHDQLDKRLTNQSIARFERIFQDVCLDVRMDHIELEPVEESQLMLSDTEGKGLL